MFRSNGFGFNLEALFPTKRVMFVVLGIVVVLFLILVCKLFAVRPAKSNFNDSVSNFGSTKMTHQEATEYALKYVLLPTPEKEIPANKAKFDEAQNLLALHLDARREKTAGAALPPGSPSGLSLTAALAKAAPAAVNTHVEKTPIMRKF